MNLTTARRKQMPQSDFAGPGKPGSDKWVATLADDHPVALTGFADSAARPAET